jgi:hypothetical protein
LFLDESSLIPQGSSAVRESRLPVEDARQPPVALRRRGAAPWTASRYDEKVEPSWLVNPMLHQTAWPSLIEAAIELAIRTHGLRVYRALDGFDGNSFPKPFAELVDGLLCLLGPAIHRGDVHGRVLDVVTGGYHSISPEAMWQALQAKEDPTAEGGAEQNSPLPGLYPFGRLATTMLGRPVAPEETGVAVSVYRPDLDRVFPSAISEGWTAELINEWKKVPDDLLQHASISPISLAVVQHLDVLLRRHHAAEDLAERQDASASSATPSRRLPTRRAIRPHLATIRRHWRAGDYDGTVGQRKNVSIVKRMAEDLQDLLNATPDGNSVPRNDPRYYKLDDVKKRLHEAIREEPETWAGLVAPTHGKQ